MKYDILSSGSKGNAVVLDGIILIDCGVSFKKLKNHCKKLQLVLLTHIHSDHMNQKTLLKLHRERPTLRFAGNDSCVKLLVDAGVNKRNIDVLRQDITYSYGRFTVSPVSLTHDVPCFGYRIFKGVDKVFYATDTGNLDGIEAKNYSLYMVECNYEDEDIRNRIAEKESRGEYVYEYSALKNHLSRQQCDDFICSNIGPGGQYVYLHMHEDKKKTTKLPRCSI